MASNRRRGNEDSTTRAVLIDAAMRLLAEEGVSAVSARRIAEKVGLSHQIVHYYFKSMDDLLMASVESGTTAFVERLRQAAESHAALDAVIELNSTLLSVALGTELTIYASSRPALRDTIRRAIESFRNAEVIAFSRHAKPEMMKDISPLVGTVVLTSLLRTFALERAIGVSNGHAETLSWLAALLGAPEILSQPSIGPSQAPGQGQPLAHQETKA